MPINDSCGYNPSLNNPNAPSNPLPDNPPSSEPNINPPDNTITNSGANSSNNPPDQSEDNSETPLIDKLKYTPQIGQPPFNSRLLDTNSYSFYQYPNPINNYYNTFNSNEFYDTFMITGYLRIDSRLLNTGLTEGYFYVTTKAVNQFNNIVFQDDRLFRINKNTEKIMGMSYYLPTHSRLTFEINDYNNINSGTTKFTTGKINWYGFLKP